MVSGRNTGRFKGIRFHRTFFKFSVSRRGGMFLWAVIIIIGFK